MRKMRRRRHVREHEKEKVEQKENGDAVEGRD